MRILSCSTNRGVSGSQLWAIAAAWLFAGCIGERCHRDEDQGYLLLPDGKLSAPTGWLFESIKGEAVPGPYFPHGMLNENAGDVGRVGGAGGALFSDRPRGPGVIPSASLEVDREAREVTRRYVEADGSSVSERWLFPNDYVEPETKFGCSNRAPAAERLRLSFASRTVNDRNDEDDAVYSVYRVEVLVKAKWGEPEGVVEDVLWSATTVNGGAPWTSIWRERYEP